MIVFKSRVTNAQLSEMHRKKISQKLEPYLRTTSFWTSNKNVFYKLNLYYNKATIFKVW